MGTGNIVPMIADYWFGCWINAKNLLEIGNAAVDSFHETSTDVNNWLEFLEFHWG